MHGDVDHYKWDGKPNETKMSKNIYFFSAFLPNEFPVSKKTYQLQMLSEAVHLILSPKV